jgi:hypothetical protein
MNIIDAIIIIAVTAVMVLCVRSILLGKTRECDSCDNIGCTARQDGGRCRVAGNMLRHASEALDDQTHKP